MRAARRTDASRRPPCPRLSARPGAHGNPRHRRLLTGRHTGRNGSHALARFVLCLAMGIGSLVFLGCPFRLFQRLGGGDLAAWLALPGFLGGVWIGTQFERRGHSIGRASEVPLAVGLTGPVVLAGGCPVRQVVMAGEGNGDALVGVAGLVVGGSLAHGLGLASVPAGPAGPGGATAAGSVATCLLLLLVLAYGFAMARSRSVSQPPA